MGRGVDELLRMERLIGENWRTFYYHTNLLGTVAALTEWDAGEEAETIVERYTYDAYGRATVQTPGADGEFDTSDDDFKAVSTVGNPYTFTARRLDSETGLLYFRARNYSTLFGRFIQRDPLGYVDGMNLYRYARNNPLCLVDPLGTQSQKKCDEEDRRKKNEDITKRIEEIQRKLGGDPDRPPKEGVIDQIGEGIDEIGEAVGGAIDRIGEAGNSVRKGVEDLVGNTLAPPPPGTGANTGPVGPPPGGPPGPGPAGGGGVPGPENAGPGVTIKGGPFSVTISSGGIGVSWKGVGSFFLGANGALGMQGGKKF